MSLVFLVHALLGAEVAVQVAKVVAVFQEGGVGFALEPGGLDLVDLVRDQVLRAGVQVVALGVQELQQLDAVTTAARPVRRARSDFEEIITRIKLQSSFVFSLIIGGLIWYWSESSEGSPLVSVQTRRPPETVPRAPPTRSLPRTLSRRVCLQMLQAGVQLQAARRQLASRPPRISCRGGGRSRCAGERARAFTPPMRQSSKSDPRARGSER